MSNRQDESPINVPDDLLGNSLSSSFRSLSSKRLRDPTNRKSVSFNDVPIVYEVPSHDTMRNSNSDIYRSWTYADATIPFPSSQILLPFNSTSAAAQKLHAHRLSSNLYSSSTNSTTLNRLSDWPLRTKTIKTFEETTEHHTNSNPPSIMIHKSDEQFSENNEEKKHLYRSPIIPDFEHHRILPFTYLPLSESTTTYTSMLTTNLIQSNDQIPNGHTRTIRALSATLPITATTNSLTRNNDNVSITPLRTTTNISSSSSRTVLKPATIAFHGSTNSRILLTTNISTSKPPTIPPRSNSFTAHSRLISSSSNRPLSSTNKHTTHSTTLTRSRSANISSSKRSTISPIVMLDEQSTGTHHNNLYTTTKRNPNVRQTYGSYIHHILLPADIN